MRAGIIGRHRSESERAESAAVLAVAELPREIDREVHLLDRTARDLGVELEHSAALWLLACVLPIGPLGLRIVSAEVEE